ncbi:MAG: tRNA(Ile)-lysidine synthetase [uncultured bacterium]|nr:MAG: tRNA(Ile)-lysidine synthetase [uncultured bacterium]OGT34612.1 MAG: tRNA lysidine(34) synthetase TilS [Gammaproteobacteria bacterium RIFCSPHIGHO2_02_FULL_39_13]OGT50033.1 MAG: tRNA lysidine(34) synthetase TilS [Gammaproteobacteria bacterium RIFCSPHIGHO2_12_FULL_39_24]
MLALLKLKKMLQSLTKQNNFVIAYSGGVDSHVLLHAMTQLQKENANITLHAVHVNHHINLASDSWEKHCKKICGELNIPISVEKITLDLKPGDSLEEQARLARYAALRKYLDKDTVLLTAHNLNDQAETFLLQALRGAGSKGLSAMPDIKKFGNRVLIRPLLHFSREQLEQYALENKLKWIEDDSNTNPRFRRNFLRQDIFPLLKKQYPAVIQNLARSAKLISEQEKIIAEMVKHDFEKIKTTDPKKIDLKKLREFSSEKQKLLLREWFCQNQLRMPNEKHLHQIQRDVIDASANSQPKFALDNIVIKRDRAFLYLQLIDTLDQLIT